MSSVPWSRRALQWLDLPPDVLLGVPRLEAWGSFQVRLTNHRGLMHYDATRVVARLAAGQVEFRGRDFRIGWLSRDELLVSGVIGEIRFEVAGR